MRRRRDPERRPSRRAQGRLRSRGDLPRQPEVAPRRDPPERRPRPLRGRVERDVQRRRRLADSPDRRRLPPPTRLRRSSLSPDLGHQCREHDRRRGRSLQRPVRRHSRPARSIARAPHPRVEADHQQGGSRARQARELVHLPPRGRALLRRERLDRFAVLVAHRPRGLPDGIRYVLSNSVARSDAGNTSELFLNTVDSGSGYLLAPSDQDPADTTGVWDQIV